MYLPPPSIASILIGSEVRAPSPLMGEGRGEGEVRMAKVTPSSALSPVPPHPSPLPRRGRGDVYLTPLHRCSPAEVRVKRGR